MHGKTKVKKRDVRKNREKESPSLKNTEENRKKEGEKGESPVKVARRRLGIKKKTVWGKSRVSEKGSGTQGRKKVFFLVLS